MPRPLTLLAVAGLALAAVASLAVGPQAAPLDPCAGCVADKAPHPMTSLARPAPGRSVVDPQFGTRIVRVTDAPSGQRHKPAYSTQPAFNADESLLLLYHQNPAGGSRLALYDGRSYAFIRTLPFLPREPENAWWDTGDPDVIWYPDGSARQLMRYNVSANASATVASFPCAEGQLLEGNGHGFTSWDSRVFGLRCNNNGDHFVYDRVADAILGRMNFGGTNQNPRRAPLIAPSGQRVLEDFNLTFYTPSLQAAEPLGLTRVEHASLGRNAAGRDVYNAVSFDDAPYGTLVSTDVVTGARKVIVGPATGWPYPRSTTHVSSHAYRRPGWVAVSSVGNPAGQGVLDGEILLANVDTGVVYRVAHHRSCARECRGHGYWAEPHANVSPTATRIVFGSDWGGEGSVDTYVVELPGYDPGAALASRAASRGVGGANGERQPPLPTP